MKREHETGEELTIGGYIMLIVGLFALAAAIGALADHLARIGFLR